MNDKDIIKALECFSNRKNSCYTCSCYDKENDSCNAIDTKIILDLINRLQAEIENLEYKLLGVMHFVDKWLDGAELEQDEVNRASAMREKTLQIIEKQQAEIERLKKAYKQCAWERDAFVGDFDEMVEKEISILKMDINEIKEEAIKEFAERLKEETNRVYYVESIALLNVHEIIDNLVKERVGDTE